MACEEVWSEAWLDLNIGNKNNRLARKVSAIQSVLYEEYGTRTSVLTIEVVLNTECRHQDRVPCGERSPTAPPNPSPLAPTNPCTLSPSAAKDQNNKGVRSVTPVIVDRPL